MRRGLETLRVMGVPYILEIAAPHRSPDRVARFAGEAGAKGMEVLIAAAGGNAQLASVLTNYTALPVIGVPIDSTPMRGEDALLGMCQAPPGAPVATVGINASENAAILATQILALKHPQFREVLSHRRQSASQGLDRFLNELKREFPDLCDPTQTAPDRRQNQADLETDGGVEENTPDPMEDHPRNERIRPGAVLSGGAVHPAPGSSPSNLVSTPVPQEPGTVTEDPELKDTLNASGRYNAEAPTPVTAHPPKLPLKGSLVEVDETPTDFSFARPINGMTLPAPKLGNVADQIPATPAMITVESGRKTRHFKLDPADPDVNVLEHAMLELLEGGIIAMPTDTVYGLAADATNPEAVRRLIELKGHDPSRKSIAMLIGDSGALDHLVTEVPSALERVIDDFWPGALTILFQRRPTLLTDVSDSPTIGVRIPADPVALQLLQMISRPLAVINTAMGKIPPATAADEVLRRFEGRIECVLDAGPCRDSDASTVLSAIVEPFEILREGAVKREALKAVLGDRLK